MKSSTEALTGYRGLRGEVLVALKKAQPLTAKELASMFGVTPNGLRRHLKALEASGVVDYKREIRGVGGPVFAYSLSETGEALFPRMYVPALTGALEILRDQQGTEAVTGLFLKQWSALAASSGRSLADLPIAERSRHLAQLLTSQGYMAEAENNSPTESTIVEHNCAMHAVARQFPEICTAEARFFEEVLDASVKRKLHILDGCNCCEYTVTFRKEGTGAA
jgi:DeoR family suf operon transcriptional repressor